MQNGTMTFMKGLGAGMVAGAAALAVGKVMLNDNKNITKGSAKLVKAVLIICHRINFKKHRVGKPLGNALICENLVIEFF